MFLSELLRAVRLEALRETTGGFVPSYFLDCLRKYNIQEYLALGGSED